MNLQIISVLTGGLASILTAVQMVEAVAPKGTPGSVKLQAMLTAVGADEHGPEVVRAASVVGSMAVAIYNSLGVFKHSPAPVPAPAPAPEPATVATIEPITGPDTPVEGTPVYLGPLIP